MLTIGLFIFLIIVVFLNNIETTSRADDVEDYIEFLEDRIIALEKRLDK